MSREEDVSHIYCEGEGERFHSFLSCFASQFYHLSQKEKDAGGGVFSSSSDNKNTSGRGTVFILLTFL